MRHISADIQDFLFDLDKSVHILLGCLRRSNKDAADAHIAPVQICGSVLILGRLVVLKPFLLWLGFYWFYHFFWLEIRLNILTVGIAFKFGWKVFNALSFVSVRMSNGSLFLLYLICFLDITILLLLVSSLSYCL